ncbi:hypothetical protein OOK31_24780 [Streptomyces sp. NBC_00249]|uniref:hypothetical protein n=1 Tax=Streptomyces sp. NBC_00249 TaxID=2975690 RepID=UPI002259E82B|nr:hypothetical protein [Streptomyces sp. NBC_00249]MCX5197074.1 hypothetical protein [Streptomyces sp. NBC_00249]
MVIGCGPVGLGAVAALLERGAGPVVASVPSALRRAAAARLGAHRMCLTYPPQEFGATLARLADGRIDAAALITAEAGLGALDAAFASLRRPEEHIKVLIRPELPGTRLVRPGA